MTEGEEEEEYLSESRKSPNQEINGMNAGGRSPGMNAIGGMRVWHAT